MLLKSLEACRQRVEKLGYSIHKRKKPSSLWRASAIRSTIFMMSLNRKLAQTHFCEMWQNSPSDFWTAHGGV